MPTAGEPSSYVDDTAPILEEENWTSRVIAAASAYEAGEDASDRLPNRSELHAAFLIQNIFRVAKNEVKVLCGNLSSSVYCQREVLEEATKFVVRGGTVRILLDDWPIGSDGRVADWSKLKSHAFIQAVTKTGSLVAENIVRAVPKNVGSLYTYHLLVADSAVYRVESDKSCVVAYAEFGDKKIGKAASDRFEQIWAKSSN